MVLQRPSYTVSNASFKLKVPLGWNITFIAISRKPYQQLATIKNSLFPKSQTLLRSKSHHTNEKMTDLRSGAPSAEMKSQPQDAEIDVNFYWTKDKISSNAIPSLQKDQYRSNGLQILQFNKPLQAPKGIPDYMTLMVCVEDSAEQDQVGTPFDDMIFTVNLTYGPEVDLDDEPDNPNIDPPPPPPDTNPGYNSALDRKRPSTIKNYLKYYDTVFLIDDSGSMDQGTPRKWDELRVALISIADTAIDHDTDGIDLYFLNSNEKFIMKEEVHGVQDKSKIPDLLNRVGPNGGTPTGLRVGQRLSEHLAQLDQAVGTSKYGEIKPLDLIVVTDGVPTDDPQTKVELEKAAAHLVTKKHHPNAMGIQFVQIGNDAGADVALQELVKSNNGSMVDTVPYTGTLTPEAMTRILLGGLHPNIRALKN